MPRSTAARSSAIISRLFFGGPYPKLIPMQPSPIAETSKPLFPSSRFCIFETLTSDVSSQLSTISYQLFRSFRFQRSHVDREPIFHIGFKQSLVSFVDLLNWDYFDIRGDVVFAAKIE